MYFTTGCFSISEILCNIMILLLNDTNFNLVSYNFYNVLKSRLFQAKTLFHSVFTNLVAIGMASFKIKFTIAIEMLL